MVWPLLGAVAAGGLAVAGGKAILGGDSLGDEIENITEDVLEATGKGNRHRNSIILRSCERSGQRSRGAGRFIPNGHDLNAGFILCGSIYVD
jgi:hypothetical protein